MGIPNRAESATNLKGSSLRLVSVYKEEHSTDRRILMLKIQRSRLVLLHGSISKQVDVLHPVFSDGDKVELQQDSSIQTHLPLLCPHHRLDLILLEVRGRDD